MTLTYEIDQVMVTMSRLAECLGQKSFCSKVIVLVHTHTADRLHYLDH